MEKDLKQFANYSEKITRIGVYGVAIEQGKMLLVRQNKGAYANKLDFPGGGIEFGETIEQTLRREFAEEVGMEFDSLHLLYNLTVTTDVPNVSLNPAYTFFHIGMIYKVRNCRLIKEHRQHELSSAWIDPKTLSKDQCSSLLWEYTQIYK